MNGERLDEWERRYGSTIEDTLKREAKRLHLELNRHLPRDAEQPRSGATPSVIRTVRVAPLAGSFDRTRTLAEMDDLGFTEFVELILVRLYEADRARPGVAVNLSDLAVELRQEIPDSWAFDAVQVLADRGLVEDMRTMQTPHAILTGEGRLFVEGGGQTGVIDEYRQHPANFVIVTGSSHQVAVGVQGDVEQTSITAEVPEEAWQLLKEIEERLSSAEDLDEKERTDALAGCSRPARTTR